ncbi:hypothetical protein QQ045_008707 [Rhodiola kirilowii]
MASASLMEANPVNWKRMSSFLRRPISHATCKSQLVFIRKPENTRPSSSFTLKCVFSKQLPNNTASSNGLQVPVSRNRNLDAILKATKGLRQPAVVAVLMGALLMYYPHSALAASSDRRRISSRSSLSSSTRHEHSSSCCRSHSSNVVFVGSVGAAFGLYLIICIFLSVVLLADKTSVMKLQIVLSGMSRSSLQKELKSIAQVADTSTPKGLSNVLTATILFLLQHSDHCISGYSDVDVKSREIDNLQKRFKWHKLNVENNIKRQTQIFSGERCSRGLSDEYIVVTILVAARGVHKLPSINGNEDLVEALQKLASISPSLIMDLEVLEHVSPLSTPPQQRARCYSKNVFSTLN